MGQEVSTAAPSRRDSAFSTADYEASKSAAPRYDGLCCRPNCYVRQWRGERGEESAYCSKECANNYGAGFKDPSDRERDATVSEIYGAINTAASLSELAELQKEWATLAASLNLPDNVIMEIQTVYRDRLHELMGASGKPLMDSRSSSDRRDYRDHQGDGGDRMHGHHGQAHDYHHGGQGMHAPHHHRHHTDGGGGEYDHARAHAQAQALASYNHSNVGHNGHDVSHNPLHEEQYGQYNHYPSGMRSARGSNGSNASGHHSVGHDYAVPSTQVAHPSSYPPPTHAHHQHHHQHHSRSQQREPRLSNDSGVGLGMGGMGAAARMQERRPSVDMIAVKINRSKQGFGIVLGLADDGRMLITDISAGGPAMGRLMVGDDVVKISGQPTAGRTHAAVIHQLKNAKVALFLVRRGTVSSLTTVNSPRPSLLGGPVETQLHARLRRPSQPGVDADQIQIQPDLPPAAKTKAERRAEKKAEKAQKRAAKKAAKAQRKASKTVEDDSDSEDSENEGEHENPRPKSEVVGVMYTNPLAPKTAAPLQQAPVTPTDIIAVAREKMQRKEITRAEYNRICVEVERAAREAKQTN
eukprot:m.172339 g.172339  ORF g.172339 m.172339 type:complete len:582 (+) comp13511_c0_seq1:68-1813(+)